VDCVATNKPSLCSYWNEKGFAAHGHCLVVSIFGLSGLNVYNHKAFQTDEFFLRHKFLPDDTAMCWPRTYNVRSAKYGYNVCLSRRCGRKLRHISRELHPAISEVIQRWVGIVLWTWVK